MNRVESYIPELLYFQNKHQSGTRRIREDLAVLDGAQDLCVLAGRGRIPRQGEPLAALCGLPREELSFLRRALPSSRCVALLGASGVVLLFSELLGESGMLLAVLPHAEAGDCLRALSYIEEPITLSPALSALTPTDPDEETVELLREIFFYTSRILNKTANVGSWTRILLLANLVGCRIDETSLPTQELPVASRDLAGLIAFLFCVLLTLRQRDGRVGALCDVPEKDRHYVYRVSFESLPDRKEKPSDVAFRHTDFPFLSHPAFRNISLQGSADGIQLEMILPQAAPAVPMLRSAPPAFFCLRIQLAEL